MAESLKQKTISGMLWSGVQRFGTMGIAFISNIVLARLLSPDDYGCIGMLAIFITMSNTFVDGGFGSALIQKKEPTQRDYSTIFWWNLFLSIVIYGILYLGAPFVAQFYRTPLLSSVLRVQGVILIINALNIIQSNQLRKRLNFRKLAVINIISQLVGVCVAIVTAWHGWGVWALVAQQIVASSMTSILLWTLNRWLPDLVFSMESFKQLFGFGSFILCSNLINTFCNNVQGLLIGRFFTSATMGYYTQARKLEEVASHSFSTVVDQVSYPILSKFQSDNAAMQSVLYKLTTALAYVTFPLMLVLILVAEPLITLLYGDKWLPCVPYFQILCVAGIASCLQVTYYYAVASKGESKELFIWTIIKRGAALIVLVAGMYIWKIEGLLWASAIGAWLILFANAYLASKHTGYTLIKQLKDMMPITMLSVIVFYIAYILINSISLNIYIEAIISIVLYLILYLGLSFKFRIKAFMYLFEIIRNYKKSPQNVF